MHLSRSTLAVGVLMLGAVLATRWLKVNISSSVPLGLYRVTPVGPPLARGMLVLLPVPDTVRWWSAWPHVDLLKPVAAVGGDRVCRRAHSLFVNGTWYGLIHAEGDGRPLPQFLEPETCVAIDEGAVFLASPARHSLDSRYFGSVPVTTLTAQALPVWTWR